MDLPITIEEKQTITKQIIASVNNLPQRRPRFMLDRDQIFYSSSFRRLAGKTQLLAAGEDDVLRTRLTHTLEVSQIARAIGQALDLDLDLIEAMVLGHDLGHTPFGHVGERTLHELMTPDRKHPLGKTCPLNADPADFPAQLDSFLGFKHNLQSLVVAMELEKNTSGRGLNLTKYTLYGLQAHTKPAYKKGRMRNHDRLGYYDKYLKKGCRINGRDAWSLEALLVAQADEIAQWHHDLEDALRAGLVMPQAIVEVMNPMLYCIQASLSPEEEQILRNPGSCDLETFIYTFTRIVVRTLMEALTETAERNILLLGGMIPEVAPAENPGAMTKRAHVVLTPSGMFPKDIFSYGDQNESGTFACAVEAFSDEINRNILSSDKIKKADEAGKKTILKLFSGYYKHPEKLPEECMYAFFGAYHELKGDSKLSGMCRPEFQDQSEAELRKMAGEKDAESIRVRFARVFQKRSKNTTRVEELLLMRAICNHIASMTDAEARRAARQFRH